MEKSHLINIELNNIRAVKSANIILDGITVISGENGCGKSTISKLTYHLLNTSIDFNDLIEQKVRDESSRIYRKLDQITRELSYVVETDEYSKIRYYFRQLYRGRDAQLKLFDEKNDLESAIDYLIELFSSSSQLVKDNGLNNRLERVKMILRDSMLSSIDKDADTKDLLLEIKNQLKENDLRAAFLKESRPLSILTEKLDDAFPDSSLSDSFNLYEYGVPIIDKELDKVLPIHTVENIAYIDTPMIVGVDTFYERLHWNDLNLLLKKKKSAKTDYRFDKIIEDEIINGKAQLAESDFNNDKLTYIRKDGSEFDLIECATGLKSFSILQILYKNGFLTDKTLLIIDEPEVHLHPQWVVEYARLIVLLHKEVGVKFLIASHHPDMISAIKYISEKEQTNDTLHFYLASEEKGTFTYNYKDLGVEIDDIFSSFNIALDRIDQYGQTE